MPEFNLGTCYSFSSPDLNINIQSLNKWEEFDGTWVRGSAFLNNKYLQTNELANVVSNTTHTELRLLLKNLNGFFSIIHQAKEAITIAVDHIRYWPLYYSYSHEEIYISDSAEWIHSNAPDYGYDPVSATEYLYKMYVTGPDTLSRSTNKVQPGEIIHFDLTEPEPEPKKQQYYQFTPGPGRRDMNLKEFDQVLVNTFERFKQRADKPVLLALSKGSDSRLLALMLYRLDFEDVITFTCGSEASEAQKIAHDLGFDHISIETSHQDFRETYLQEWDDICESVGYLERIPQLDRIIMLEKVRQRDDVPDNAIVVFGHNVVEASHWIPSSYNKHLSLQEDEFLQRMWDIHYGRWALSKKASRENIRTLLLNRLLNRLPVELYQQGSVEEAFRVVSAMESWYWMGRTPGYLTCGFEHDYVGFDVWLPLWDRKFAKAYSDIPYDQRIGKQFYLRYLEWLETKIRGDSATAWTETDPFGVDDDGRWIKKLEPVIKRMPKTFEQTTIRWYRKLRDIRRDPYQERNGYAVIPNSEFSTFNLQRYHPKTLWLLLLYRDGFFDLSIETELDRAIQCSVE